MRFSVLSLMVLAGCAGGGDFVRTDPAFVPAQRTSMPDVCLHKAASEPYRVVGVISVRLAAVTPPAEFELRALDTALHIGCDVLAPHKPTPPRSAWDFMRPRVFLVHEGHGGSAAGGSDGQSAGGQGGKPGKDSFDPDSAYVVREYDCGLYLPRGNG